MVVAPPGCTGHHLVVADWVVTPLGGSRLGGASLACGGLTSALRKIGCSGLGSGATCVFMGSSYLCVVACEHVGNGTGHRTVTMMIPLLFTSGLVRYEAALHSR